VTLLELQSKNQEMADFVVNQYSSADEEEEEIQEN
jgi:hypothetical protein